MVVPNLMPAANADPALWLCQPDVDWWDLVRFGPPGFEVYVRIAFPRDEADSTDVVRLALETLAACTSTPGSAFAAVWEGWCGSGPIPAAPRVRIPHREMLLFTGHIDVLRDAPRVAWGEHPDMLVPPHLVWPQDRAWCLACEVDEEIEFTVGCSFSAYAALLRAFPGDIRRARYGEDTPLYDDEAD